MMITASHNPYTDNGIKIFGSSGKKLAGDIENQLEDHFFTLKEQSEDNQSEDKERINAERPDISSAPVELYHDFLLAQARGLKDVSLKVVVDCGNGATYDLGPKIFSDTGLEIITTFNQPDGKNINRGCGSTEPDKLKEAVLAHHADLGIAFDGDGDRVLFVDKRGHMLDGDHTLYLLAKYFLATDDSFKKNPIVVGTVMSNLGAEKAINGLGATFTRTDVGDKYVYRELERQDALLGGEQSGHTILRHLQPTGDGILTALIFIKALSFLGMTPTELSQSITHFPQVLKNVRVKEKRDLNSWGELQHMIKQFNDAHGTNSRLSIRYSGTEPLMRLMMESESADVIDTQLGKFEQMVKETIGA
jgi:phosphoglucosamine mutase